MSKSDNEETRLAVTDSSEIEDGDDSTSDVPSGWTNVSAMYAQYPWLRAAVSAIPMIGGSLDQILSSSGADFESQRVKDWLTDLDNAFRKLEEDFERFKLERTEASYNLIVSAFRAALSTESKRARQNVTSVVTNALVKGDNSFEEARTVLALIGKLRKAHVDVLNVAYRMPVCEQALQGMKVVVFSKKGLLLDEWDCPQYLPEQLPDYPPAMLRVICAELASFGLFRDEGINRHDIRPGDWYALTDTADWFANWVTPRVNTGSTDS
ncbi:hypothetical protein ACFL51_00155 [Myxococcota bacterium]